MSKVSLSSSSRNFHLVLYPDASNYTFLQVIAENVVNLKSCSKWAHCIHDMDTNDDGSLKKAHCHLVLSCKYPVRYKDILSALGVPESAMTLPDEHSKTRTFRSMVRYLVHADSPKKYQYDIQLISSNFDVSQYFDDASSDKSSSAFLELLDFMSLPSSNRRSVALYAASCGLLGYYRQYYRILWDIIDYEDFHNRKNILEDLEKSIDNFST